MSLIMRVPRLHLSPRTLFIGYSFGISAVTVSALTYTFRHSPRNQLSCKNELNSQELRLAFNRMMNGKYNKQLK